MTDRDNTDNGVSDEDAVWRDLVARYDVPLTAEEPVPWPEREGDPRLGGAEISDVEISGAEISGAEISGAEISGAEVGRVPAAGSDAESGSHEPSVMPVPRLVRGARDSGGSAGRGLPAGAADDDDDHFVPPPPPPLPKLDPLAKGAWVALFGGPGYLVVATGAGWTVPGFAAFCAVAAFVAGFAILVLRMNEPGPGGPDDGDDGAVV
ncbi:MAG TPA: hypothetical protein VIX15_08320 [Streptosporangiaceae bacterium]